MKRRVLTRLVGFDTALTVVAVDQITKYLIVSDLFGGHDSGFFAWLFEKADRFSAAPKKITEFFNLVMVWNPGISFGFLQTDAQTMPYVLSAFALAVAAGFAVWLWRGPDLFKSFAIGLIIGGALGNVWDRLRFGAVADFLDFHAGGLHWPAFNVADAAVSVGVVLLLWRELFYNKEMKSGDLA